MKKSIIIFMFLFVCKVSNAQFLIQANGPLDICYPNTVTLSVSVIQPGYDYTWYLSGYGCPLQEPPIIIGLGPIMNVTTATGQYSCMGIPQNGGPPEFSNDIMVRILQFPIALPAPGFYSGTTSCVTSVSLCIPDIFYANWPGTIIRWYKNNVVINGASGGSYVATSEGYYKYSITSGCTSMSDSILVTTLPSAAISTTGSTTFCSGGNVMLNAPVASNRNYQWKKGGTNIPGATSQSYIASTGGNYKVTVTNTITGCSRTSASATVVTVNPLPAATITPQGSTTFCAGGSVVLKANTGTSLTYKWKKGSNYISGATLLNYTATTAGNYRVQVTNNNGCSKTSAPVTVTVPCREEEELMSSNDFNVSVFPNPAQTEINIVLPSQDDFEIEIVNTLGERSIILQNQNKINISNLSSGIYFIKIVQGNNFYTRRIIKQ